MNTFIPEEILEDIRSRCDIVEVINSYIPLRRAGSNFKTLCPFHNEKTPSFIVSPSKQIYHCFGCGAGGDVFNFIMQYEKIDFVDAVKLLADRVGVVIPEKSLPKGETGLKDLWEVNRFACELFHKWLFSPIGNACLKYIRGRDIKIDIIKKFMLGYAPGGNQFFEEARRKGFSEDILLKSGLAVRSENNIVDMFRNRLIFPIFNHIGKVVGFSGRVLDDGLPKYINTQETPLFHKGKVLYGLHVAKPQIMKEGEVIICEGYFDFLRAYQEGLQNVVASQGTAFTIDHVNLLRRYASCIIVSFDADTAGATAALRGLDMFISEGIRVKVLQMPEGYDPDTFIKEKGVGEFHRLIAEAKDILETKLDRLCSEYPINTTDGKLKIISRILTDINNVRNEIYKRQFVTLVARRLGVPEESIWIELKGLKRSITSQPQGAIKTHFTTEKVFASLNRQGECPGERQLVQVLMDDEPLPEWFPSEIIGQVKHPGYKALLDLIIKLKKTGRWKGPSSLLTYIKDENLRKVISQLSIEELPQGVDKQRIIRDCIYDIKKRYREDRIRSLIARIEEMERNKQDVSGLVQEMNELRKEVMLK